MEERLIRELMATLKCVSCGKHYNEYDVDILSHREDLWFLRVLCSSCHTQALVAAVVKEETGQSGTVAGLSEVGPEALGDNAVCANDVLDMHNFLKDFDGDFSRLFARRWL